MSVRMRMGPPAKLDGDKNTISVWYDMLDEKTEAALDKISPDDNARKKVCDVETTMACFNGRFDISKRAGVSWTVDLSTREKRADVLEGLIS